MANVQPNCKTVCAPDIYAGVYECLGDADPTLAFRRQRR